MVSRGLADTSLFIARESGRPLATERLPDSLDVSVISIGELRAGVLAASDTATRDRRLATLLAVQRIGPLPIDEPTAEAWARLRVSLHDLGKSMPVNDCWIAATALGLAVPVVTRDDDCVGVPGLEVIQV